MNDNKKRIEELRYQIEKLSPMIEKECAAINEASTFAEKFAAKANAITLENRKRELKELLAEQQENQIELRFTGESIEYGTAPVDLVVNMTACFQKLLQRMLQSQVNSTPGKRVSENIRRATRLRFEAFAPGSFRVLMAGPTDDDGMFNQDESLTNNHAFRNTVENIFSLFQAGNDENELKKLIKNEKFLFKAYREYIDTAKHHNINIDTMWLKANNRKVKNSITAKQFAQISEHLQQISVEHKIENHRGIFRGIDTIDRKFVFESQILPEPLRGTFDKEVLVLLKRFNTSPVDNKIYNISVDKIIDSSKDKPTYKLLELLPDKIQ